MSDARLPEAYLTPGTSSFAEFVGSVSPDLLPSRRVLPGRRRRRPGPARDHDRGGDLRGRRGDGR